MGGGYKKYADKIWKLRNGLVHTGINVEILMSKSTQTKNKHLTVHNKYLYVNTLQFLEDLRNKIDEMKNHVRPGGQYHDNAKTRLQETNLVCIEDDIATPTPAPDEEPFSKSR